MKDKCINYMFKYWWVYYYCEWNFLYKSNEIL